MKYSKLSTDEFYKKHGTVFYLFNEFEEAAIKVTKDKVFVKFKGQPEFVAKIGSNVVANAYLDRCEITENDYDQF